ncbi:MAG: hypothetical protein RMM29_00540 [Planctomycetota bacterium]|nr:hypothetical protein [Planctomycetota bacterium]MCX8039392.1 hypothetical protein [Planctomycetota bacterium]MDW8372123.1 hypothetical protein [Planctomycetota bacterium]
MLRRIWRWWRAQRAAGAALDTGAMILAVDYQRRGSNFDCDGQRFQVDRQGLAIGETMVPYEQVRCLRVNRSYLSGLLGRCSLPGLILIAFGLLPAKRLQTVLQAELQLADGRRVRASSFSARGFGKLPVNQLDAFRWFLACLAHRLPPSACIIVGSVASSIGGALVLLCAALLAWVCWGALEDADWWLAVTSGGSVGACLWVGIKMCHDGRRRRVDEAGLLAYLERL